MKSKKEILQDVVELIKSQGGRSIDINGLCKYMSEDGKICGHSMALTEEYRLALRYTNEDATKNIDLYGDNIHQEKYQGHDKSFWKYVQGLHDEEFNWNNNNELTEKGISYINSIQ